MRRAWLDRRVRLAAGTVALVVLTACYTSIPAPEISTSAVVGSVFVSGKLPAQAAAAPGIQVQGDLIVTTSSGTLGVQTVSSGQAIVTRGVNFSGAEYACLSGSFWDVPAGDQTTIDHMRLDWHANVIRLPLNEGCWLGVSGKMGYEGQDYIDAMSSFVNLATASGMLVEVDLHFRAGKESDNDPALDARYAPSFWKSVAHTFRNNHSVIFNLINEPHGISWACLRDGGSASRCETSADGPNYKVVGTQSLVNTIRATGATNPIIIAGLDWSDDLRQWIRYKPTDTLNPPQIIAGFHPYFGYGNRCEASPPTCWNRSVAPIQTAGYPVIADEIGDITNGCLGSNITRFMNWADAQAPKIGYWAWAFTVASCSNGPSLITDAKGTPTQIYGQAFHDHLMAVQ
jgi:Endoglucanase